MFEKLIRLSYCSKAYDTLIKTTTMPGYGTKDLKMPVKMNGSRDKRYTSPQFCKTDGTRDMRTKLTGKRKTT